MAFTFKVKASQAPLDAGVYPGYLVGITEFESTFGPALKWHFVAMAKTGEHQVTTVTSQKMSTESKAYQFAEAILQRRLTAHEEFAPAQLYSEICDLVVTVKELDSGSTVNRIDRVMPHKNKKDSPFPLPLKPDDGELMDESDEPF